MIDLDVLESHAAGAQRRLNYAGADDPYGRHVAVSPNELGALVRVVRAAQAVLHAPSSHGEAFHDALDELSETLRPFRETIA